MERKQGAGPGAAEEREGMSVQRPKTVPYSESAVVQTVVLALAEALVLDFEEDTGVMVTSPSGKLHTSDNGLP